MVDSIIAKNQASIKAMASDDNSEIDITSLRIDSEGLSHESEYSSSLLNLIKYCEENINAN